MIDDIFNAPIDIEIGEKVYQIEYDNKSYATAEKLLDMGVLKIFKTFIVEDNLSLENYTNLVCAGLIKHHSREEIAEARAELTRCPSLFMSNFYIVQAAFSRPLIGPAIADQVGKKKKPSKKKSQKK